MTHVTAKSRIPVEFVYDEETTTWSFHVDQPRIVGGGCDTLDEARQHAADAIAFALEGDPSAD
jgi:predicted RNase H-like HicB family nuclease